MSQKALQRCNVSIFLQISGLNFSKVNCDRSMSRGWIFQGASFAGESRIKKDDPRIRVQTRASKICFPEFGPKFGFRSLVAHDCGYPLSRYTCRATRIAADFLDFIAFCRCSTSVALHPLKTLVSHLPPPVCREVSHRNLVVWKGVALHCATKFRRCKIPCAEMCSWK